MIYVNFLKNRGTEMEKQIKSFLEFLKIEKKMSENTLQSYERDVLQFQKYLNENKLNYAKLNREY